MTQALLRVQGLTGGYGDVQVLWGLDLEVARGEIVCLVGSNGAGKTTLMRTLSGLIPARAGHIQFNDVDLSYANPERALRAGLAHVPEGRRLFSAMSVRDNLLMGAYLREDGVGAIHADLERMYVHFPILKQRHHQAAGTLSGGEQQMCAIARGLMSQPKYLLLDEPSLGLAPIVVKQVMSVIKTIAERGIGVLLVEQNATLALNLADHAYLLETGKIVLSGPSEDIKADESIRRVYLGY